jgi:hypothetical protein
LDSRAARNSSFQLPRLRVGPGRSQPYLLTAACDYAGLIPDDGNQSS